MSPKKSSSKKPSAQRSASRKKTAKSVTSGESKSGKKAAKSSKRPSRKPQPLTLKPDEMPADVLEFIQAIDDYKRLEGRPFPTWSEVLDIVKELGYERKAS